MNRLGACRGVKTFGRLAEIAGAHDVVSLEHAPSLVPRQLHRNALRDAGADKIANSGSAEVVENTARDC